MNVDFEFDFESEIAKAYLDDEIYQDIAYIAKDLDMKGINVNNFMSCHKFAALICQKMPFSTIR